MSFLSKIFLSSAAMRREKIQDDYSVHRFVYSLFPKEDLFPNQENNRFLYVDKGPVQGGRLLLILSEKEPQYPEYVSSSTAVLSDAFFQCRKFRFEVELNPVRRDCKDGKRRAVIGQLDLLNWFTAHAERWGFSVDTHTLEVLIKQTRKVPKGNTFALFNCAVFRGILQVQSPELFKKSCLSGLGHGKAFGFGLMQLVPVFEKNN